MKFGELIPLIGALLNFSLAVFVLFQSPRAAVARVYFLMGMCFAVWNFGTFWMFRVPPGLEHYQEALQWARFLQFGVIFIPLTLCHVSFLVAQIRIPRWIVWVAYSCHVGLFCSNGLDYWRQNLAGEATPASVAALHPFFLAGVHNVKYAWYSVAGTGFWILSGVFSLMWVSVAVLIWRRRTVPPLSKRRLTPLIIAQTAFAIFGCNDVLPILGIYTYPFTHYQVYPFGSMAVILYGVIVGYSVLQYQLLDVHVTLSRSTAMVVRVLFIFFSGLCSLLVFWLIDKDDFNFYSFFSGLATLMIGALLASLVFPRLFGETSEGVERQILGDTFEYQDQVRKFIETINLYTDIPKLFNDLHELLTRVFQLEGYYLILRNETNQLVELAKSHPAQPPRAIPELRSSSAIFRYFDWEKRDYLALSDKDLYTRSTQIAQQARAELAPLQGRFCFPLAFEGEIFGLLVVGNKTREQFTGNDIRLLITLVKSLSLIVNQIRLKTQVQHQAELDLLGKMSRGMAHDLNNLLTPVWTLLQLSIESGNSEPLDDELLPVALRNVSTMRSYIREALFFSENLRPDLQLGRLDLVIRQAADLAKASRKKDVEVLPETPGEALVEMDEVLIQRLIANLISNSIDASPEKSQIRVQLERLTKAEPNREWWRVRVIDSGEGIPKENLTRILMPYFTTKNRGDENRGFGLGLAICRKIVTLHGGQLTISSQPKKGTTVQFDLPGRQIKTTTTPPVAEKSYCLMRTLLVISKQPALAHAVQAVLDPVKFQLISKEMIGEAEFLLSRGAIDATILDVELTDARAIRLIEELRSFAPGGPILVYAGEKQWEWEEDAYLLGVEHVLTKPVRGKLLNTLLDRMFPLHEPTKQIVPANPSAVETVSLRPYVDPIRALEALRRFSGILTHSLDASGLLKQFLLLLREIIGVNRAVIFLRRPSGVLGDGPLAQDDRWLRSACAIGHDQSVLQHFALSLGAGIGGHLHRQGRILRASSPEAHNSREISKEFQLLGAQVAIPILDRESLLGVVVFDERLTGEPYANEELALIFHMLEEVGLAIRNTWLHDQLVGNHDMVADILGHLGSGCLVIGGNLATLHANIAACEYFLTPGQQKGRLEFSDLPQEIGSRIFTVIKSGETTPPFRYDRMANAPGKAFRVSILPFRTASASGTNAALLIIEDVTEHERAQRLDIEASNLRLVKSMAEHLAHEIGNSLVPLSTHQQLLKESINDPEFQESLSSVLAAGVKRISRLSNQMVFLAREWQGDFRESVQIADLIVEAFHEAHTFHPGKKLAQLQFNKDISPWKITGDHKALRHAFSEIILNALQANPEDPNVAVHLSEDPNGLPELRVEVRDSGPGFEPEAARRAPEPFFSTRMVGLGLGLTVSRKIIESHHGKIEIPHPQKGEPGIVLVSLPLQN